MNHIHNRSTGRTLLLAVALFAGCDTSEEIDEQDRMPMTEAQQQEYAKQLELYNKGVSVYPAPGHPDASAMDPLFDADLGLKSGIDE